MASAVKLGTRRFSLALLASIDRCLALHPEDRVRSVGELRAGRGARRFLDQRSGGLRSANRLGYASGVRDLSVGIRVARTLTP